MILNKALLFLLAESTGFQLPEKRQKKTGFIAETGYL